MSRLRALETCKKLYGELRHALKSDRAYTVLCLREEIEILKKEYDIKEWEF